MFSKKVKKIIVAAIVINIISTIIIGVMGYAYVSNERIIILKAQAKTLDEPKEQDTDFVNLGEYIPGLIIDLRYDTTDNIVGSRLYQSNTAYLRRGTAQKLKKAEEDFQKMGYRLKVWDAYRPPSVQYILWNKVPDPRFIADPKTGSNHNRGAAVDVTLVDSSGKELAMPTGFDNCTTRSYRDYKGASAEEIKDAKLLESVMLKNGFTEIYTEWWHFDDSDVAKYPIVSQVPEEFLGNQQTQTPENKNLQSADIRKIAIVEEPFKWIYNKIDTIHITDIKNNVLLEVQNFVHQHF